MVLGGKSGCFGGLKWCFCCQLLSDIWKLTTIGRFGSNKKHRNYKGFLCFEFKSHFSQIQYLVSEKSRVRARSFAPDIIKPFIYRRFSHVKGFYFFCRFSKILMNFMVQNLFFGLWSKQCFFPSIKKLSKLHIGELKRALLLSFAP